MTATRTLPSCPAQPESCLDWRQLWITNRARRDSLENEEYWDGRAASFLAKNRHSSYAQEFLDRLDARPGESVIDMGCGTGTLALPLAAAGHRVTACDLSKVMLAGLTGLAEEAGLLEYLDIRKMSWLDTWDDLPVADLLLASRSLYSADLYETILKMEAHARRRICVTVGTNSTPGIDAPLLKAIGRPVRPWADHTYILNMLLQMGRKPELSYITHVRSINAHTIPELREDLAKFLGDLTKEELVRLDAFVAENFSEQEGPDGTTRVECAYERVIRWAFIAWDVPTEPVWNLA